MFGEVGGDGAFCLEQFVGLAVSPVFKHTDSQFRDVAAEHIEAECGFASVVAEVENRRIDGAGNVVVKEHV